MLFLDHTKVTDAGLVHLRGLTKLDRVSLIATGATEAGSRHFRS